MAGGVDVTVTGAEQLRALSADLKAAGSAGVGLRRELLAGMRALGRPLADKAKASARSTLPKRGGLNEWVASSDVKVRNNLTGSTSRVGMRLVATKGGHDLQDIDGGSVRHMVFGHRDRWVNQQVPDGWFTHPLEQSVPEVQAMLTVTMAVIAKRIERA